MLDLDAIVTLTSEESSEESSDEEFVLLAVPDAPMYCPVRTDARVRLSSDHRDDDYYVCFPKEQMNVGVFDRSLLQHKLKGNYTKKSKKPIQAKEELEENPNEFFEDLDDFSRIPRPAPVEREVFKMFGSFKRQSEENERGGGGKLQKEDKNQDVLALDTVMTLESEESSEESSDEEFIVLVAMPNALTYSPVRTDDARVGLSSHHSDYDYYGEHGEGKLRKLQEAQNVGTPAPVERVEPKASPRGIFSFLRSYFPFYR